VRVVINGAGQGIGAAIARGVADSGARVVIGDIDEDKAQAVADSIGRHARAIRVDVRDRASLEAVQADIAHTSGLDVLVNAHGLQLRTHFADCDEDTWMTLTDVNLNGVYRSCQVFGAPMRARGGAIVNMGSVNGVVVSARGTPYGIQKAAVAHLTRVLAVEWAPQVRVNAIAPTAVPSGMTQDLFADPQYLASKVASIPLRRYGTVQDIVHAVVFLASPASGLITGQTLVMDGGLSLV
jgi:NAD(P)-dependent dehydrogenase (short-subunit alcohol dehydrogenase family)